MWFWKLFFFFFSIVEKMKERGRVERERPSEGICPPQGFLVEEASASPRKPTLTAPPLHPGCPPHLCQQVDLGPVHLESLCLQSAPSVNSIPGSGAGKQPQAGDRDWGASLGLWWEDWGTQCPCKPGVSVILGTFTSGNLFCFGQKEMRSKTPGPSTTPFLSSFR